MLLHLLQCLILAIMSDSLMMVGVTYFDMMKNEHGIEPTVEDYGCLVDILC